MTNKLTKEYIIETCEKYKIENYTINNELSIDVNGNVDLYDKGLTELPLTFNIVEGDFYCSYNKLTSLKGAPRECDYFYCDNNKLTNIEYAPNKCNHINYHNNKITNLNGNPKCKYIAIDYYKLNLDNEELYVIEAILNNYTLDENLQNYYNMRLKMEYRNNIINSILN